MVLYHNDYMHFHFYKVVTFVLLIGTYMYGHFQFSFTRYTWDYGADLGIDENEGQFISTRRDLTLSGGRQAPEGKTNQEEVTPTGSPNRLDTRTPEVKVTPASSSTRSSLVGTLKEMELDSDTKTLTDVTALSDRENTDVSKRYSDPIDRRAVNETRLSGSAFSRSIPERLDRDTASRNEEFASDIKKVKEASNHKIAAGSVVGEDSGARSRDPRLVSKSKSYDNLSETSLTDRITDLMERESPQRQALNYLQEAERSWQVCTVRNIVFIFLCGDTHTRLISCKFMAVWVHNITLCCV